MVAEKLLKFISYVHFQSSLTIYNIIKPLNLNNDYAMNVISHYLNYTRIMRYVKVK
jgi:hypothetical protein